MMNAVPSHHPKYRTKLCRNFSNGTCPFGEKCSFLHPAPGINPLSSSLAHYLLNWNMLLPQLLALQQGTLKKMPQRSPPRPKAAQLVDEDTSPPASLLLSTSDSASSEQMRPKRRYNKREKLSCRHFVRTGGWCPAGEQCRFHHDVTALPSAEGGKAQHPPPPETDVHKDGGRTISGVLMDGQVLSPPIISHEYPARPRYTEAGSAQPYQPLHWPGYGWHSYQQYHPFVLPTAAVRAPATMAPSSIVQHNTCHPPPPRSGQSVPPNETQTSLPSGAYQVNGTTYFPTQMPSAPALPVTCSIPIHPAPYNQTMPLVYPYYAPPMPVNYYDIPNQRMDILPSTSFDPFSSDRMVPNELPVIPRLEDYQISPIQHGDRPRLLSLPSALSEDSDLTNITDKPKGTHEQEFPYQPPKEQRVGHARRISINIKKQGRTSCG